MRRCHLRAGSTSERHLCTWPECEHRTYPAVQPDDRRRTRGRVRSCSFQISSIRCGLGESDFGVVGHRTDTAAIAHIQDFIDDGLGHDELLRGRYLVEVRMDVLSGWFALTVRQPTLTEPDENPREATRACRVVAMREVARPAREKHDEWHHQLRPD